MNIEIRPLLSLEEYQATETLQSIVWGLNNRMIVPVNILVTAQREGGLVLGAFDKDKTNAYHHGLIGFVFSSVGLTPTGQLKQCSQMAGVVPAYQNQQIGYRLKCVQRDILVSRGFTLITWTFNPLIARNARFNLHKLGATCNTYLPNVYGTDSRNKQTALPTDRFYVEWNMTDEHVCNRLGHRYQSPTLPELQNNYIPQINPIASDVKDATNAADADLLLVEIPRDIQAIERTDMSLAVVWQEHVRYVFETLFARGYQAVDVLVEYEHVCYLLQRS
jgi:chorismate synthase